MICVGYLGELIVERIGAERFGIAIDYSHDGTEPIGTLGAVRKALPLLGRRFLVLYGDTYLRLDYRAVATTWIASGFPAMMTVYKNEGRWDTSNVEFDGVRVTSYDKRTPTPGMQWIDYGLGGLTAEVLGLVGHTTSDLADLYRVLSRSGDLSGVVATERFYEIGSADALLETSRFLAANGPID